MADYKDPFQGRSESLLDVGRLCGPIVETVNDHIYFVHFSAKEYVPFQHPDCNVLQNGVQIFV